MAACPVVLVVAVIGAVLVTGTPFAPAQVRSGRDTAATSGGLMHYPKPKHYGI